MFLEVKHRIVNESWRRSFRRVARVDPWRKKEDKAFVRARVYATTCAIAQSTVYRVSDERPSPAAAQWASVCVCVCVCLSASTVLVTHSYSLSLSFSLSLSLIIQGNDSFFS